jgi:hypothetical protein
MTQIIPTGLLVRPFEVAAPLRKIICDDNAITQLKHFEKKKNCSTHNFCSIM